MHLEHMANMYTISSEITVSHNSKNNNKQWQWQLNFNRSKDNELTNSGRVSMQIIDFFVGCNVPYLCVTFVGANSYQITLQNNTLNCINSTQSFIT